LVAAVACAHAKPPLPQAAVREHAPAKPEIVASIAPSAPPAAAGPEPAAADPDKAARDELVAALDRLRETQVFFGFDETRLTGDGMARLADMGAVLWRNRNLRVRIDGHCDERGTAQYNLVLGQERADVARRYLLRLGVGADQVVTVSYGEERPKSPGHDEAAWQVNRRDDVVVSGR